MVYEEEMIYLEKAFWEENVKKRTPPPYVEDGDLVLLSPACASFDAFANFAQRGDHFRKIVMELE